MQGWARGLHICWNRCLRRFLGAGEGQPAGSLLENETRECRDDSGHIPEWRQGGKEEVGFVVGFVIEGIWMSISVGSHARCPAAEAYLASSPLPGRNVSALLSHLSPKTDAGIQFLSSL